VTRLGGDEEETCSVVKGGIAPPDTEELALVVGNVDIMLLDVIEASEGELLWVNLPKVVGGVTGHLKYRTGIAK